MRFRPANISLINRRHYLPRLPLTLSSNEQTTSALDRSLHINFRIGDYTGAIARCAYNSTLMQLRVQIAR